MTARFDRADWSTVPLCISSCSPALGHRINCINKSFPTAIRALSAQSAIIQREASTQHDFATDIVSRIDLLTQSLAESARGPARARAQRARTDARHRRGASSHACGGRLCIPGRDGRRCPRQGLRCHCRGAAGGSCRAPGNVAAAVRAAAARRLCGLCLLRLCSERIHESDHYLTTLHTSLLGMRCASTAGAAGACR